MNAPTAHFAWQTKTRCQTVNRGVGRFHLIIDSRILGIVSTLVTHPEVDTNGRDEASRQEGVVFKPNE